MTEFLTKAWPIVGLLAITIGGVTTYYLQILQIRELKRKLQELEIRAKAERNLIMTPTSEEAFRYGLPFWYRELEFMRARTELDRVSRTSKRFWILAIAIALYTGGVYYTLLSHSQRLKAAVQALSSEMENQRHEWHRLLTENEAVKEKNQMLTQENELLKKQVESLEATSSKRKGRNR